MSKTHRDFKVEHCGMIIAKHHPWLHATPDVLTSCSCYGDGCCEVKCPYSVDNCNFEAYVEKKDSGLEKINNTFRLKRSHQYAILTIMKYNNSCLFLTASIVTMLCVHFLITSKQCFSWREFTRTPPIGILFFPNLPRCGELVYYQKFVVDGIPGRVILLPLHQ